MPETPKRVLVTGASGSIGSVLVERLAAEGVLARVLVRSGRGEARSLPASAEIIEGDITDRAALQQATKGVNFVFHLAAKLHINSPAARLRDEYWRTNVEGTRLLVEAARRADVERLVLFSTINVYGASSEGEVWDEDSPLRPASWYAETKLEAERIVLGEMCRRGVVLRLAAVYGRSMKGNYVRLLEALEHRRFVMIGDGRNRRTLIHVEDACRAALLVARAPSAAGETYNATDGEVHTLDEIIRSMCAALGRRPPRASVPKRAARFAAGLVEDLLQATGRDSPLKRLTVDKFTEDVAVSGLKIQRELGFRPRYDLPGGWREVVGNVACDETSESDSSRD
ncbi:MAG: NAD-dependent epimerase/dehydratase family protein [Acidobacteriota bacterium]|nr:NAD-dependent epimerase/dehydratase family protein [Acidobacteriota bacterium]